MDAQTQGDDRYRQACLDCHAGDDCAEPMPSREAAGDDCVQCHMRRAEPDDQLHTEFTDHWIRRDIVEEERDFRQDPTIEPIFPAAAAAMSEGERLYHDGRAYFLLTSSARRAWKGDFYRKAEELFRAAIEAGYDNRGSNFFLGKILSESQRPKQAIRHFTRALEHAPEDDAVALALGQELLAMERYDEALTVLGALLERRPDHALGLAEYARAAWAEGRMADALEAYERAVEAEPWNATLQVNLGMTLAKVGRYEEAALVADTAASLDPDGADVWFYYWNVMREAGRPADSRYGLDRWRAVGGGGR